jgi:hypothetical protein
MTRTPGKTIQRSGQAGHADRLRGRLSDVHRQDAMRDLAVGALVDSAQKIAMMG